MRHDEAYSATYFILSTFRSGISDYMDPNNHILNTVLAHISYVLFGNSPWALRLPALLAGIAVVPATYAAVYVLWGPRAAVISTSLIACSSGMIEYSTNARGYIFVTLCTNMALVLAAYISRRDNVIAWCLLSAICAVGFYAVPTMLIYSFAIVSVWLLVCIFRFSSRSGRVVRLLYFCMFIAGVLILTYLLYLPAILRMGLNRITSNRFVTPLSWGEFTARLPSALLESVVIAQSWISTVACKRDGRVICDLPFARHQRMERTTGLSTCQLVRIRHRSCLSAIYTTGKSLFVLRSDLLRRVLLGSAGLH